MHLVDMKALAVDTPCQLSVEVRMTAMWHWVCAQYFAVEARFYHNVTALSAWKMPSFQNRGDDEVVLVHAGSSTKASGREKHNL